MAFPTAVSLITAILIGLFGCANPTPDGPASTEPDDSGCTSRVKGELERFKDEYPGGMLLQGKTARFLEHPDLLGRGYYHGSLVVQPVEVLWVGVDYGTPKAAEDIFGRLAGFMTSFPSTYYEPPFDGGPFTVGVASSPEPLESRLVGGREVILGVARCYKYPVVLRLWSVGGIDLDFGQIWDRYGGRPGAPGEKAGGDNK